MALPAAASDVGEDRVLADAVAGQQPELVSRFLEESSAC